MPTKQQGEPVMDLEKQGQPQRDALIGGHVLRTLGQPAGLHRVDVRRLWGEHYRVNVLLGADVASVRIAHSYFLVTDEDGNIVASTPTITKHY